MILGDNTIKDKYPFLVVPFNIKQLNAASYNFKLNNIILEMASDSINSKDTESIKFYKHVIPEHGFWLMPNILYLGSTVERLNLPNNIGANAEGRSSTGRIGMTVHLTAGWCDPGFKGHVTLEIFVLHPTLIYPNMECGQFIFKYVEDSTGYKGHYQGQESQPIPSRGNFYKKS